MAVAYKAWKVSDQLKPIYTGGVVAVSAETGSVYCLNDGSLVKLGLPGLKEVACVEEEDSGFDGLHLTA
jgi:hypothetical protein